MNKLTVLPVVLACVVLSPLAVAHGGSEHRGTGPYGNMPMDRPNYGQMMSEDQHEEFFTRMTEMHELMEKAEQEKDPAKRRQLLQQHLQLMQNNMHQMSAGWGYRGKGPGMMGNQSMMHGSGEHMMNGPTNREQWDEEKRLNRLEQQIGMMQQMLQQLMDRENQRERTGE